jgi:TPR repeat protein
MRRPILFASSALLALACSSEVPSPVAPQGRPEGEPKDGTASPAKAQHACGDAKACLEAGKQARELKDKAKARESFEAACDQDNGEACNYFAGMVQDEDKDEARAATIWKKGCDLGDGSSCFNAAEKIREQKPKDATSLYAKACKSGGDDRMLASLACGRGAIHAFTDGDFTAAADIAGAGCSDKVQAGCNVLGVIHAEGRGVPADKEKATAFFKKACAAGDQDACNNEKKVANALDVPGANITMGSVTADGFTLTDVTCKSEGGGLGALLLGPAVAGALGKKKAAFNACAPKGADVRVRWTMAGGKVTNVEAKAGDPKIEACVVKAVKSSVAVLEGTCAASFHAGK